MVHAITKTEQTNHLPPQKTDEDKQGDVLLFVLTQFLDAINKSLQNSQLRAKTLMHNQSAQGNLNRQINSAPFQVMTQQGQIYYTTHTTVHGTDRNGVFTFVSDHYTDKHFRSVDASVFHKFQITNQNIAAERDFLTNKVNILQQDSQIQESNMNSSADYIAQQAQESGSITELWGTLASLIAQITKSTKK